MADVIPLRQEPLSDVVLRLENLLALAREGKIVAIGYATVDNEGVSGTGWTQNPPLRSSQALCCGANILAARITNAIGGID